MDVVPLAPEHEIALKDLPSKFKRAGEVSVPAYFADPAWSRAETVRCFADWSTGEGLDYVSDRAGLAGARQKILGSRM